MLNIGVIGLGFMGATHVASWQAASAAGLACRLRAVADPKPSRRAGNLSDVGGNIDTTSSAAQAFDPAHVRGYADPSELLADKSIHAVSICTPTASHVDLCIAAMRAGKHVLIEKPVALTSPEIDRLIAVRQETRLVCMPAMCMRFWPGWAWLKQRVDAVSFGPVRTASFSRLAARPNWSMRYSSSAQTGGALFDLHIHDADFVRYCFGDPSAVLAVGSFDGQDAVEHLTCSYVYENGPQHVIAEGGWDHHAGFAYRMRYVVNFADATADFDIGRRDSLLLCRGGRAEVVDLAPQLGYELQVRHFVALCESTATSPVVSLDDAVRVTDMLSCELESIRSRRMIDIRSLGKSTP
jgi:predicted dehydrogenase